jgi:hypothetical protein
MYRAAIAMGYDSVAHYLVLTNQEDEEARKAAAREAAVKAEAFAQRQAAEAAAFKAENIKNEDGEVAEVQEKKKPHWMKPKVVASE